MSATGQQPNQQPEHRSNGSSSTSHIVFGLPTPPPTPPPLNSGLPPPPSQPPDTTPGNGTGNCIEMLAETKEVETEEVNRQEQDETREFKGQEQDVIRELEGQEQDETEEFEEQGQDTTKTISPESFHSDSLSQHSFLTSKKPSEATSGLSSTVKTILPSLRAHRGNLQAIARNQASRACKPCSR